MGVPQHFIFGPNKELASHLSLNRVFGAKETEHAIDKECQAAKILLIKYPISASGIEHRIKLDCIYHCTLKRSDIVSVHKI